MPPAKAKPKKSTPLSLRVPPSMQERVACYAAQNGLAFRAALLTLADERLDMLDGKLPDTPTRPDPHTIMEEAKAKAAHLGATRPKRERNWAL